MQNNGFGKKELLNIYDSIKYSNHQNYIRVLCKHLDLSINHNIDALKKAQKMRYSFVRLNITCRK